MTISRIHAPGPSGTQQGRSPSLAVLIRNSNGVPFEEGLQRANKEGVVIASNLKLDTILVNSEEWQRVREAFCAWSGTMTAYREPGEKLGEQIEYVDSQTSYRWVFPVPQEHREKIDAILVAEPGKYVLEIDGTNRVVHPTEVDLVEGFPASNGRYLIDGIHCIPIGEQKSPSDPYARYLWRGDKLVAPVARDLGGVGLFNKPSSPFGMVVETADR